MSQKHLGAKSQVEGAKSVFYVSLSQDAKADAGAPGARWCSHVPQVSFSTLSKDLTLGTDQTKRGWRRSFSVSWFDAGVGAHRCLHSKALLWSSCCGQHRVGNIAGFQQQVVRSLNNLSIGFFCLLWGYIDLNTGVSSNVHSIAAPQDLYCGTG